MANAKSKADVKKQRVPLPEHFNSLEDAAEFWDTHDSAEYEDLMADADFEVDIKKRTYLIPLDVELYRKVETIARRKGVAAEALVNRWIEEKAS
ncbi:MAG TPA: CopG family antitoxin [Pyrinomonadaceae bacterium]|nr:CopG family antitoxin [Pyrinomonadaceae bacterium]